MQEKEFVIWSKEKNIITAGLESGVKAIIVEDELQKQEIEKLGKIDLWVLGKDIEYIKINNKQDEERASKSSKKVLVETTDWTIIPLENIIAQKDRKSVV